jgi:two-component system sensor histidine kinase AgrC
VQDIPLERTDVCRAAGILVENAIDELLTGGYERKLLEFGIILSTGNVAMICTNTCKNPPPIEEIFKENFSTKGTGRGLGLFNLKQICKKNGNAWVSAHSDDGMFTVTVTMAVE